MNDDMKQRLADLGWQLVDTKPTERRQSQAMRLLTSQETNEWYTPGWIIDAVVATVGYIDLDPCSCSQAQTTVQANTYYTIEDDGLSLPWFGTVWCNPPFSKASAWVDRMESAFVSGEIDAGIMIVNSALGYNWYEEVLDQRPVCQLRERVAFIPSDRPFSPKETAKKGQSIIYYGYDNRRFDDIWRTCGRIRLP